MTTKTKKKLGNDVKVIKAVKGNAKAVHQLIVGDESEQAQCMKQASWNPLVCAVGKSKYVLDAINFYDENGVVFAIGQGWLENAHGFGNAGSIGFKKDGEYIPVKRKAQLAYNKQEVYIVSKGRDWSGDLRGYLYIPMAYLESFGYEVQEKTYVNGSVTSVEQKLVTSGFKRNIAIEVKHDIKKAKAEIQAKLTELSKQIEKCDNTIDLNELMRTFKKSL